MKNVIASLFSAATLSISSPTFAQVGPGYVPANVWRICLNNPSTFVNIRTSPSTLSPSKGQLRHNERVIIVNRFVSGDGMYWVGVRSRLGLGFVRDDYTCTF